MKKLFGIIILLSQTTLLSQKMITRSGEIKFEASMPAFEEVKATNKSVSCVFDKQKNEIAVLVLMKAFKFRLPLMEEHFNENYVESTLYPKATFKGRVIGFDAAKFTAGKMTCDTEGDLTIHGVTKKIKTKMLMILSGDKLIAKSNFSVKPQDFMIEIPSLVKSKIAENIKIEIDFVLENK